MHRPTLLALLSILFSFLGVMGLLIGMVLLEHNLITQSQLYIAPFASALAALISLILGWAQEPSHDF